ncbi:MAG: DNA polymerase Y family protein [Woeseiaceae bacterium]|nr:DNA polymerase Y family protein [Woeseiaceae bacterium]
MSLAPVAEAPAFEISDLRRLWLCIHLPALPLEALGGSDQSRAVFEESKGIRKILLVNNKARSGGIRPGLSINAALALQPGLLLEERKSQRELEVLRELAEWAGKFTSLVCIEEPSLLLLEIAGSLKLFGGVKALRQRIVQGFTAQGFTAAAAIAPTPLAATWLARAGRKACVLDARNLRSKLAPLPLACLCWPEAVESSLRGMGITCIGEALRLPRQGFAKRFGAMRLLQLDRALGRLPDPRVSYRAPERFVADYDLQQEQSDSELLLNACELLLKRLEDFLLARQIAVQHLLFSFFHLQSPATHLPLGCVQADRATQHWFELLKIRFERLLLPAPVIAIQLRAGRGQCFAAGTATLPFDQRAGNGQRLSVAHLGELLSARIGDESVHGVAMVAEHRPQYAWRRQDLGNEVPRCADLPDRRLPGELPAWLEEIQRTGSLVLRRPLWMLEEPSLLAVENGRPVCGGVLQLLDGPERLETGWWDDDGIARDYFVARNPQGVHLWVYRDRKQNGGRWFLHGMFG